MGGGGRGRREGESMKGSKKDRKRGREKVGGVKGREENRVSQTERQKERQTGVGGGSEGLMVHWI